MKSGDELDLSSSVTRSFGFEGFVSICRFSVPFSLSQGHDAWNRAIYWYKHHVSTDQTVRCRLMRRVKPTPITWTHTHTQIPIAVRAWSPKTPPVFKTHNCWLRLSHTHIITCNTHCHLQTDTEHNHKALKGKLMLILYWNTQLLVSLSFLKVTSSKDRIYSHSEINTRQTREATFSIWLIELVLWIVTGRNSCL